MENYIIVGNKKIYIDKVCYSEVIDSQGHAIYIHFVNGETLIMHRDIDYVRDDLLTLQRVAYVTRKHFED